MNNESNESVPVIDKESIIKLCSKIFDFCLKETLLNKEQTNLMFDCQFTAHVEWLEVRVMYQHYALKLIDEKIALYDDDIAETFNALSSLLNKLCLIADGKYSYEVKLKI